MPRISHDKPGLTYACPACDQTVIYERTGGNARKHPDRPYRCEECGVCFNYIIERPLKCRPGGNEQTSLPGSSRSRTMIARELVAVGPEDVGLSPIGVRSGQP